MSLAAPAVTGSVSAYSVAPALLAGVALNASTGVISGTPTAVAMAAWLLGNRYGVVLDGASLGGTPRYFGYDAAWSIAGSV